VCQFLGLKIKDQGHWGK